MKRSGDSPSQASTSTKKMKGEACPHGVKCYRKNPHHFREFGHPHLEALIDSGDIPEDFPQDKSVYRDQLEILRPLLKPGDGSSSSSGPTEQRAGPSRGATMLDKIKSAEPYNYFFTTIPSIAETLCHPTSITFTDLLCPSLGQLKDSLQINFMIDIMWLMEQYAVRKLEKVPMTILYGDEFPKMKEYIDKFLPNVTHHFVKMKDPFGCHHSKIGIYRYSDDSIRVVVSTANLYYEDWNHYNQGLWLSPPCPSLPPSPTNEQLGDSPTNFKAHLLKYLRHYGPSVACLKPWIDLVVNSDFTSIRVFLVTSVPGKHYPKAPGCHAHQVADLLTRHCNLPVKQGPSDEGPLDWGVIAQASSIGSMGKAPGEWLRSSLLRALATHKRTQPVANPNASISLVFPTVDNVMGGLWGADSGGCLPYSKQTNEKQRWLQGYLHQWKASSLGRSRAMPHLKTYCRVSPDLGRLAWFLVTSANISKSAWGGNYQKDGGIYVRSYEAGVLFLPDMFGEEYFEIVRSTRGADKNLFPMMYDLPLTEYKQSDYPWCN